MPDTVYASADRIWFKVERVDTATDGRLVSLADLYADSKSIMTFRRTGLHQANYGGTLDSVPSDFRVAWRVDTDTESKDTVYGPWGGGSGWTGQPLLIEWPDSLSRRLKASGAVNDSFNGREVIVGSLCGNIYFINPDNGKQTRTPIVGDNPIKGTASFDPTFNGMLYVGQGTPARRPFGAFTVDLFSNEIIHFFPEDPKALRRWGAFDSSAIRVDRFLFRPAENGSIYKFLITDKGPQLHTVLRYKVNGAAPGIEASPAVWANYGITADNHGNILCVNLDNMTPVWYYSLGDDTDATPMIVEEDGKPYVYVGCEIDRVAREHSVFAKLRVADGTEVWRIEPTGRRREDGKKHFDGGFYASPLLGQGDCSQLVFTNMVKNTSGANGVFMAINRADGSVRYEVPLRYYAWSSPVGFVTKQGKQIVVTADCSGNVYIIEGSTGKILKYSHIGYNFESTPIVVGNSVIVGSRTNGIFRIDLI